MAHILYKYLHAVRHPTTGLLESFPHSADPKLHHVAFTYDLALASLVFTHHGSLEEASSTVGFFRAMPLPTPATADYNTAYHVDSGLPALERAFQVGPLAWASVALMRYAEATKQMIYFDKALRLLDWVRRHVDHVDGGVVMGTQVPWTWRMSVENNWAYYAALRMAIRAIPDGPLREAFGAEKKSVRRWLLRHEGCRGHNDSVKALDVFTNALLVGPEAHLEDVTMGDRQALAMWAKDWVEQIEAFFRAPNTPGYDYTDANEARRIGRDRVMWLEGTEQVVVAYQTWAPFFEALNDPTFAHELLRRASLAHAGVMRCSLLVGNAVAIPNTDAPEPIKTFTDGWYARPDTEPALNGTTWTYFAEAGYNPLTAFRHNSP